MASNYQSIPRDITGKSGERQFTYLFPPQLIPLILIHTCQHCPDNLVCPIPFGAIPLPTFWRMGGEHDSFTDMFYNFSSPGGDAF